MDNSSVMQSRWQTVLRTMSYTNHRRPVRFAFCEISVPAEPWFWPAPWITAHPWMSTPGCPPLDASPVLDAHPCIPAHLRCQPRPRSWPPIDPATCSCSLHPAPPTSRIKTDLMPGTQITQILLFPPEIFFSHHPSNNFKLKMEKRTDEANASVLIFFARTVLLFGC